MGIVRRSPGGAEHPVEVSAATIYGWRRQFPRRARRAASTRHCRLLRPQIINVSVHDTGMAWGHIIRPLDTDLTSIPHVIYYSKTQVIMS